MTDKILVEFDRDELVRFDNLLKKQYEFFTTLVRGLKNYQLYHANDNQIDELMAHKTQYESEMDDISILRSKIQISLNG